MFYGMVNIGGMIMAEKLEGTTGLMDVNLFTLPSFLSLSLFCHYYKLPPPLLHPLSFFIHFLTLESS